MSILEKLTAQYANQPKQSVVDSLPYREYRRDRKIFILDDASLGVVYKFKLKEHEPMAVNDFKELKSQLELILSLPSNCLAQFYFTQTLLESSAIEKATRLEYRPENKVAEFLRNIRISKLASQDLFDRNCYLSLRFIPETSPFNLTEMLPEDIAGSVLRGMNQFEKRVEEFEKILSRIESLSQIKVERIDATELRTIVRSGFGLKGSRELGSINNEVPLNEQMFFETIHANSAGLLGKTKSRTISFLVPSDHYEGASSLFVRLNFPFTLSLRMSFPSKGKTAKFLGIKEWCTKNSFSPKSKRQFEDIQSTKKRLAEGDPCVHLTWSVTVYGESVQELNERANKVSTFVVEAFDCNSIIESEIGFDILRAGLPLHFDPKSEWGTQRHIPLHRSEIINFLPIFDSFKGTENPLQIYRSRDSNLVPFSTVEGQTSQHGIFLGDSGSGKSAFINSVINGLKAINPEPICFVLDFNTSQTMNVKFYNGELNVFNHGRSCPASVFRGVYDQKKISVLTNWVCEAIRLTSPSFILESEHKEAISQAVRFAFKKKVLASGLKFVEGELFEFESNESICIDMDSLAAELAYLPALEGFERFRKPIEDLLVKLRNFYGDGLYANYFRPSTNRLNFDKRFYVYDLGHIQDDPVLLNLTVGSIFEEIRQLKILPENQSREIWAILDEIAALGRESELLTQYFINKAETARKDAFWIYGATNRPQNFFEIPVCLALFQVAEHFCFLPMDKDNVQKLSTYSEKITNADKENIASLRTERGVKSEIYYLGKSTGKRGVLVYEQTPHERWQSPTNAKEGREALKSLKKHDDDAVKAIEYLVLNHPNGIA